MDLRVLFLLFMIYSFIGWIIEVIDVAIINRKVMDRGFLIGPYLPIFGVGAILITLILSKYSNDIFVLFIMSCFLGATLEYITSYIMEKIFNTRWWDYSKDKFNLNGRVCFKTTIAFGILGIILIKVLNPFFISIVSMLSPLLMNILVTVLAFIFIVDIIVSFSIISNIKIVGAGLSKDTTEEVTAKVKEVLRNHSKLSKRLVSAFPDFKFNFKKINELAQNIRNKNV